MLFFYRVVVTIEDDDDGMMGAYIIRHPVRRLLLVWEAFGAGLEQRRFARLMKCPSLCKGSAVVVAVAVFVQIMKVKRCFWAVLYLVTR